MQQNGVVSGEGLGVTVKGDTIAAAAEEVYTKHPRSPLAFCTCRRV